MMAFPCEHPALVAHLMDDCSAASDHHRGTVHEGTRLATEPLNMLVADALPGMAITR
jgi:hypothetical protein